MKPDIVKSGDLGQGWFASVYGDGSATVRNIEKGQRINLPPESVAMFLKLWDECKAAHARS